jgi:predicted nucleic acid-binding protein
MEAILEVILDASAIMAVVADEAESEIVIYYTEEATIVSPNVVSFEIANGLTKMMKKKVIDKERMINIFKSFKRIPIKIVEINIEKALKIAWEYKIYAYDAFYLESAQRLNLPLLTFDRGMAKIGKEMGITVLGGKNAGV